MIKQNLHMHSLVCDCHRKQSLDFGYEEAVSKIKEFQFKGMMVLTLNGFVYKELDTFMI